MMSPPLSSDPLLLNSWPDRGTVQTDSATSLAYMAVYGAEGLVLSLYIDTAVTLVVALVAFQEF